MSTYSIDTLDGSPHLLRGWHAHPVAVVSLDDGRLFVHDRREAAAVWHAATTVLAPSDEQIEAISDRSGFSSEEVRHVLAAVQDHAEGAAT